MILRSIFLILAIALLVLSSNAAYKAHKENAVVEKYMQMAARNRWNIPGTDLEKFFIHHPDYYCHLHMHDGKRNVFTCFEPGTYQP